MKYKKYIIVTLLIFLSSFNLPKIFANTTNQILITEIGNHEPSDLEWIEIFNNSELEFDLNGLTFKEQNTNHKTTIMQGSNILYPNQYALIVNKYDLFIQKYPELINPENIILDSSWTILSNEGELLELNSNSQILDQITYSPNTTTNSLERIYENQNYSNQWIPNANNNSMFNLYNTTEIPEENEEDNNDDPEPTTDEEPEETNNEDNPEPTDETEIIYLEKPFIIISEVSFNSTPDWIEIFIDPRGQELNLENLKLEMDNKKIPLGLSQIISQPTFAIVETNLVATTEQISLEYNDEIFDSFCWIAESPPASELAELEILKQNNYWQGDCPNSTQIKNDFTFYRPSLLPDSNSLNDFKITNSITKGQSNTIQNQSPTAKITIKSGKSTNAIPFQLTLDASKSTDPEQQELTYEWNTDQKTSSAQTETFKFETTGEYQITLNVTDTDGATSTATLLVIATPKPTTSSSSTSSTTKATSNTTNTSVTNQTAKNIQLSSFNPNPKGTDTELEWIEITNLENTKIQLENYYLDDEEGGSTPFQLKNITLNPQEKFKIPITTSKISLGNTKDSVRLLFGKEILEEVYYENAKDDEIFTKTNNQWLRSSETEISANSTTESTSENSTTIKASLTDNKQETNTSNGTLNDQIKINEVLPNPKGTDKGLEWIELYNPSDTDTKMGNWILKFNTKEYKLDNFTIKAKGYYLIKKDNISIPNSNLKIELKNFNQKTIYQFEFEKSKEAESIFKINSTYHWTNKPTPNQANPSLLNIQGTITNLDNSNQTFTLQQKNSGQIKIQFTNNFSKQILINSQITGTAWQYSQDQITLNSIDNIKSEIAETEENKNILWTLIIPFLAIPGYIFKSKIFEIISFIHPMN